MSIVDPGDSMGFCRDAYLSQSEYERKRKAEFDVSFASNARFSNQEECRPAASDLTALSYCIPHRRFKELYPTSVFENRVVHDMQTLVYENENKLTRLPTSKEGFHKDISLRRYRHLMVSDNVLRHPFPEDPNKLNGFIEESIDMDGTIMCPEMLGYSRSGMMTHSVLGQVD